MCSETSQPSFNDESEPSVNDESESEQSQTEKSESESEDNSENSESEQSQSDESDQTIQPPINKIYIDHLYQRVQQPKSMEADNEVLRKYWISSVIANVEDLEEKIRYMENDRISKSTDVLQAKLNKARIDEIFRDYRTRSMFFCLIYKVQRQKNS